MRDCRDAGPGGQIIHLNQNHELSFGERRRHAVGSGPGDCRRDGRRKFEARASDQILQEMWEKWVFLAAFAGSTCLLRAAIGDIVNAPGGREIVLGLIEECRAIAQASGFPPRDPPSSAFARC